MALEGVSAGASREITEKLDQVMLIRGNKEKYNDFLKNSRKTRQSQEKASNLLKRTQKDKIPRTIEEIEADPDLGLNPEYDRLLAEPKLGVPLESEPLYVEKPIGPYEPPVGFAAKG